MPNNLQQVALHTWLLLVPILLLIMGVINGLASWQLPVEWHPVWASLPVMLLVGGGLLATQRGYARWARLCGWLLLPMAFYSPVLALMPQGWVSQALVAQVPLLPPVASLAVMVFSICLVAGIASSRARLLWWLGGIGIILLGTVSAVADLRPDLQFPSPWGDAFTAPYSALPALLAGTAMLCMARHPKVMPQVSRGAVWALCGGVLVSGLGWYALIWQQHAAQLRHANEIYNNFKTVAERSADQQQNYLQRMAQRWAQLNSVPDAGYRQLEAESAFRDIPSLEALFWQSEESERFVWGRERGEDFQFLNWLEQHDWVLDWLAVGGSYPRWILPDEERAELALMSVPLSLPNSIEGRLVAVIDLKKLLSEEISALVTPLPIAIHRRGHSMTGNVFSPIENQVELRRGWLVLPGGTRLEVKVYGDGPLVMGGLVGLMPLVLAVGGLILSYLLGFSLTMADLSRRRSLALARAQRNLRSQQRVQTLIARDQPLEETLKAICKVIQAQVPGGIASIMLIDASGERFQKAFSLDLPQEYLDLLQGVEVGPNSGSCGRAAYLRDFVVSADIANDPRWRGFHEATARHGLAACWSYPIIGSSAQLLGTFAIYERQPGYPKSSERRRVMEAVELVSLAVERERHRRALEESEQRYRSLFTYHPDAVFSLDLNGYFTSANTASSMLTGYSLEQLAGAHYSMLVQPEELEDIAALYRSNAKSEAFHYSVFIRHRQGHDVYLDVTNLPIVINGRTIGFYGIAKDMTEKHRRDTELRLLQRSVEASINGIVIVDAKLADMPIVYVNEAFERITGYSRSEVMGRNCRLLQGGETDPERVEQMRRAIAEQREVNVTLCNYRKNGTPFWNNLSLAPVRNDDGMVTHYVGILDDISERKDYEARLSFQASHDTLTGLANRMLFEQQLQHGVQLARRYNRQLAVLFVDLDDFKPINDSLGHDVGDKVLIEIGQRLAARLAPGDTLARFGSDEFVILLPDLSREEEAIRLVESLLTCVRAPCRVGKHELYVGASVGIAFLDKALENPVELIQQADMAMYRAKQKGRNAWECFTHEINDEVNARMALRNDLQEAIEAENFELHYQPLVAADGQRVTGIEALVRWRHPIKGYLSPGLFIPLAEDTGQIGAISDWVLRQACRDMCRLAADGDGPYRVSINVSPLQFHRANFLTGLQQVLLETGLAPEWLELELTEGILMSDAAGAMEILQRLREMGVEVSIDDFGTGFSSLSYLKTLPISKIKIDRSFVRDVVTNQHDSAIVQGIISMAHHLGLVVVAEGIEDEQQRDFLVAHGCDVFQGFLFARPMPFDKLQAYLRQRAAQGAVDMPGEAREILASSASSRNE